MKYKGFTYTPAPKTAWDNLSMLEKSEMMKVAVRNGIADLKTIREKYNEFAGGGGIHIKPENRGKFTALKERTGHWSNPNIFKGVAYPTLIISGLYELENK